MSGEVAIAEKLWWGYRHVDGGYQVKPFFDAGDIHEALSSPFVASVVGAPFMARGREDALNKVKERLG